MYLPTVEALKLVITPEASRLLTQISRILAEQGIQSYLVGGFVRDMMMDRATDDIDIAVAADALKVADNMAEALGGRYVPLDKENGVGRVILYDQSGSKWEIDFATLQGDIQEDLARRDFTIDAMAIELKGEMGTSISIDDIIDPFRGQDDLKASIVRAVCKDSFKDDPVRLLRGIRLAAELGFTIEGNTQELIHTDSKLITDVAGERVREELVRLLAVAGAGNWLEYLDESGLLTALIPEMAPAKGVDQPKVHVWDVFEHSIQTVRAVEFILRENDLDYAGKEILEPVPWSEDLIHHFDTEVSSGSTRRALLKLAALLHDIAKPQTKAIDETGRARFLGHPQDGADMAAVIMERLRFSTREIKLVELLIKYHLRPTQMSHEDLPSQRAIYRYFRDTGDTGIDILFLSLADHLATRGVELDMTQWREHCRMVEYVLCKHSEEESLTTPLKLIDGHDIMQTFGVNQGPEVGQLLEAVKEAQATGEVNSRQQAIDYAKRWLDEDSQHHLKERAQGET
jgi:poly(A) polymerase